MSATIDAENIPHVIGGSIPMEGNPISSYYGPVISPDQKTAVELSSVQNEDGSNSVAVTVVSTETGTRVGNPVAIDGSSGSAQFSKDSKRIYVMSHDDANDSATFAVIDAATGEQLGGPVTVDGRYGYYKLSDDGTRAYLFSSVDRYSTSNTASFAVIDTETGQQLGDTVTVENASYSNIQYSADGKRVILMTTSSNPYQEKSVRIINTENGELVGTPISRPYYSNTDFYVSNDGSHVYTLDHGSQATLTSIDTATGTAATPIDLGNDTYASMTFLPKGDRAFVTMNHYDGTSQVAVIDTANETLVAQPIQVDDQSSWVTYNEDGSRAIVTSYNWDGTNYTGGHVTVIDPETGKVVGQPIVTDGYTYAHAFSEDGTRVYVTSNDYVHNTSSFYVVNTETGDVMEQPTISDGYLNQFQFTEDRSQIRLTSVDHENQTTTFALIDAKSGTVVGQTNPLNGIGYAQPSTDGSRLYYTGHNYDDNTNTFAVIDPETGSVLGQPVTMTGEPKSGWNYYDDGPRRYLTSSDGTVTSLAIVDNHTGEVAGGAPVTVEGDFKYLGYNADKSRVYVTTEVDNEDGTKTTKVAMVNGETGALIGATPLPLNGAPAGPAYANADGTELYQLTSDEPGASGFPVTRLNVIDPNTGEVLDNSVFAEGYPVTSGSATIDGHPVIVLVTADSATDPDPSTISTIVIVPGTNSQPIVLPGYASASGYDTESDVLYLMTARYEMVDGQPDPSAVTTYLAAIDLDTGQLVGEPIEIAGVPTGYPATWMNKVGGLQYTTSWTQAADGSDLTRVTIVDTETGAVRTIDIPGKPAAGTIRSSKTPRAIQQTTVTNPDGTTSTVAVVIDSDTGTVVGDPITVPGSRVGSYVYDSNGLSYSADGSRAYQFTSGENPDGSASTTFTVIDTQTGTVVGEPITLDGSFDSRAFSSDGTRVYLTTKSFDEATGSYSSSITVLATGTEAPIAVSA
ncbi:hypothetical protein A5662_01640 [Mycobacteriaceae bacterium 1482268.1]|nr:hypothetical protein A5662_01640 [Mycobacteriaceae bacterium 1482268.1]